MSTLLIYAIFLLKRGETHDFRWVLPTTLYYLSGKHDSASCSTVILGTIAAWPIKTYLSTS